VRHAIADKILREGSPIGLHRVVEPVGVLPQAAAILDTTAELWPDETRIRVQRLNLDAASYRQLVHSHHGDGDAIRNDVVGIINRRGKMHNPVTGSGGMLLGVVDAVGPEASCGFAVGDRIASLVSLTLTPLLISDGLRSWSGLDEQVPAEGHAILFGRTIAAILPADLPDTLALAVLDVCGAPALTARVVQQYARTTTPPVVAVIGAAGKSGSLSLAAARQEGAGLLVGIVPTESEARELRAANLADAVVLADARDPVALAAAIATASGRSGGADVTVICVDVPGCEGGAIFATNPGGTVIFFSMATSFSTAALTAEGLAADVTMLIGNGYLPGHAEYALGLVRANPEISRHLTQRITAQPEEVSG
jgi:L-erythro-3,5-diaminohexanoate dehydrogenase